MSTTHPLDPGAIRVVEQGGPFGEDASDYARERIATLDRYTKRPILFAKIRLIEHVEPTAVLAKGSVDIDGDVIFAQAHGFAVREAIDRVVDTLRREIIEQSGRRSAVRHQSLED